jgi:hypothetical protein
MRNKKFQIPTYVKWLALSAASLLLKLILDLYFPVA